MITTIKSDGSQVFNVPNTEEGRKFIEDLRKYRQNKNRLRLRGRGTRKEHGNDYSIAVEHSEWIAVYIDKLREQEAQDRNRRERWEMGQKLREANNMVNELAFQLEVVREVYGVSTTSLEENLIHLVKGRKFRTLKRIFNDYV